MRTLPLFCLLILCCSLAAVASALTVTGVSPAVAYADSARTYDVYGTGFAVGAQVSLTPSAGGTVIAATGEDWVDFTHLRCTITVPAGVIPFDALIGLYDVTVSNPRDTGSGSLTHAFIVYPRPTVAGILPTGRPAPSVFTARLDGTGFRNGAEVYLRGGTGGTSTFYATGESVVSSTQIDCTFDIPATAYPGPYDVYVRNHPDLDYLFCMNDAFIVQLPTSTYISGVSPGSALPGATLTVNVTGYGFTNGAEVRVEGGVGGTTMVEATGETFVSHNQIRCTLAIPADAYIGSYSVYLRNPGGEWVSKSAAFTVTAPIPTVSGISPSRAYPGQTLSTVYVLGTGFARGASVVIGPSTGNTGPVIEAADETFVNTTAIRCSLAIPASASPGLYSVYVTNTGNHHPATAFRSFTVLSPTPTVTAVSPDSAAPGDVLNSVIVSGANFTTGAEVAVHGGTGGTTTIEAANETFVSPTQIRCSLAIPADAYPGSYTVTVTNPPVYIVGPAPTGSRVNAFTITAPTPAATEIAPNSALPGTALGTVTVTGTGFANGEQVRLKGGPGGATWIDAEAETWINATTIRCALQIPDDAYPGLYQVCIGNSEGSVWFCGSTTFTVTPPMPYVTGISPDAGHCGETLPTVYVYGTGFANGAQVSVVNGPTNIDATGETFLNSTTIRCSLAVPATAYPGTAEVRVRNPLMTQWSHDDLFTIIAPTPTVTGISPNSATPGQTLTPVNVSGTGFTGGAWIKLRRSGAADIMATDVVVGSPSLITCRIAVPSDAVIGPWDIVVNNPTNPTPGTLSGGFTVTAPTPITTDISPDGAYPAETLTGVRLSGTGFANGASVLIRHASGETLVSGTDVVFVSPTEVRCTLAIPDRAFPDSYYAVVKNPGDFMPSTGAGFSVLAPTPTVTGISPDSAFPGQTLDTVYVYGTGFTVGAQVYVSGYDRMYGPSNEVRVNSTTIRCTLTIPPSFTPGSYYVSVVNPTNTWGQKEDAFTVTAPTPTVTGIVPSTATPGQTLAAVNVTGTGFATGANVTLRRAGSDDIAATDVVVVSPSLIECRIAVPSDAVVGPWDVEVNNPTNPTPGTLSGGFTVLAPAPAVLAVPPSTLLPTDTDGDGLYDDANGNGRADFADVVLYFNQIAWIAGHEPVSAFDCNGNGRIDFADVVWLFNHL